MWRASKLGTLTPERNEQAFLSFTLWCFQTVQWIQTMMKAFCLSLESSFIVLVPLMVRNNSLSYLPYMWTTLYKGLAEKGTKIIPRSYWYQILLQDTTVIQRPENIAKCLKIVWIFTCLLGQVTSLSGGLSLCAMWSP